MILRRNFITLLGGAAAWPLAARAQAERTRRIGLLIGFDENDPLAKPWVSAFTQALAGLGWSDGRNMRMDHRWGGADINRIRALAQELVGLQPDIILASGTPATVALQRQTRTIPIVFASVNDPVASGIVPVQALKLMAFPPLMPNIPRIVPESAAIAWGKYWKPLSDGHFPLHGFPAGA
jgi:putative ABC transport system substrate-binding protein